MLLTIQITAGVVLAFLLMELLTYIKQAPLRAQARRERAEFEKHMRELVNNVFKDLETVMTAEKAKKPARRPATKKAPVKKPVAKAPTKKNTTAKKGNK